MSHGLDAFVVLNLHCDGTNGSTSFPDGWISNKTVTAQGSAAVTTAVAKFGTGSANLNLAGDYLTVPDSDDWNFGTGDFTIDFWVYQGTVTGTRPFIWQEQGNGIWILELQNDGVNEVIRFTYQNTTPTTLANYRATHAISLNTWTHIALVRSGTSIFIFKDGVPYSLTVDVAIGSTAMPDFTGTLMIGGRDFAMNGRMDELRISKGIARWTTNFTPPTEAYDAIEASVGAASGTSAATGIGTSTAASTGAAAGAGAAAADSTGSGVNEGVGTAAGVGTALGISHPEIDVVGSCAAYRTKGRLIAYSVTGEAVYP